MSKAANILNSFSLGDRSVVHTPVSLSSNSKGINFSDKKYIYHYVTVPNNLPFEEMHYNEIHLVSHIIRQQEYCDVTKQAKTMWIPLCNSYLRDTFGEHAEKHLKKIVELNIAEFKMVGNSTFYFYKGDGPRAFEDNICQHVRLCKPYWSSVVNGDVTSFRVKSPRLYLNGKKTGKIIGSHKRFPNVIDQIKYNYLGVTVKESWQNEFTAESIVNENRSFIHDRGHVKSIYNQSFNVIIGTNNRAYHPIIEMSRKTRKYVTYNGKEPIKLDIKACHPCMMAKFIDDIEERDNWLNLCKTDIYTQFQDDKHDRDSVKKQFQVAISHKKKFGKALEIIQYIEKVAPSLHFWLVTKWNDNETLGDTVQMELQQLESKIFVDGLFVKLSKKFWCLPMHDGIMTTPEAIKDARRIIKDESIKNLGFELLVERQ